MKHWVSVVAIVALCAGYILYYTSQILHKYPTTMAMSGAMQDTKPNSG